MTLEPTTPVSPRWLHALAVLTVLLTLPLLFLGAGVTSHGPGVAMSDQQGFRLPWVILNTFLEDTGFALRLEHGHRLFGFLVGLCGIGLAAGCYLFDQRPLLRWMGFLALTLICTQGLLGIFRVDYNALHGRTFALVHGVFAQVVFAVLVSVAVFTSRRWTNVNLPIDAISPALQRWSIVTVIVVFTQLILGGVVRHTDSLLGPRGHLLGAFLVVGVLVWLLKLMRESEANDLFKVERIAIKTLLTLQLLLGIESWLAKFPSGPYADLPQLAPMPMHAEWIRTVHYLMGTLIFSTTVVTALVAHRRSMTATEAALVPAQELEVAR